MAVIRLFLLGEAVAFCAAALIHGGYLVPGYAHRSARIAESVIGLVLALAWAFTLARRRLAPSACTHRGSRWRARSSARSPSRSASARAPCPT
jgi:hypothetical protein